MAIAASPASSMTSIILRAATGRPRLCQCHPGSWTAVWTATTASAASIPILVRSARSASLSTTSTHPSIVTAAAATTTTTAAAVRWRTLPRSSPLALLPPSQQCRFLHASPALYRLRYHIAAAGCAKGRRFNAERDTHLFSLCAGPPSSGISDGSSSNSISSKDEFESESEGESGNHRNGAGTAIGIMRGNTPGQRRRSRPNTGQDAFFVAPVGGSGDFSSGQEAKDAADGAADEDNVRAIAFGVADGVGGWADSGVDPANFSHALCTYMAEAAMGWRGNGDGNNGALDGPPPRALIQMGYDRSAMDMSIFAGGSTATVGVAHGDGRVDLANLGDSGFVHLRDGKVVNASIPQTHDFNTPFQLSLVPPFIRAQAAVFGGQTFADTPASADVSALHLRVGDVLLLTTDGVFDNLFPADIQRIVTERMLRVGAWRIVDDGEGQEGVGVNLGVGGKLAALAPPDGLLDDWPVAGQHSPKTEASPFPPSSNSDSNNSSRSSSTTFSPSPPSHSQPSSPSSSPSPLPPSPTHTLPCHLAAALTSAAIRAAADRRCDGPFARAAQVQAMRRPWEGTWQGGKVDDVAVVVVVVGEG